MKYLLLLILIFTSCSIAPKSDDYYVVPEKLTIGFPDWIMNTNITYSFQPKQTNE